VEGSKELVVINTHNSAYDDGSLRRQQMVFLQDFLLSEYEKGNYIIAGGDWNQTPFGFDPVLPAHQFDTVDLTFVEKDYPAPGWNWAFDSMLPSNRRVSTPYNKTTSLTTVIDYYLLSPNLVMEQVQTLDTEFKYSDHQPVQLKVKIKP
jgi:endonuclease/exonuclease/phosphatase family metal-dependent hydrolase